MQEAIAQAIEKSTGRPFALARKSRVGGGCINETYLVEGKSGDTFFVKQNARAASDFFEAEASGLRALASTETIRVPEVIGSGKGEEGRFLILEALDLGGRRPDYGARLGAQLAAMHRHTGPGFGFERDNYIGTLPQENTPYMDNWADFFRAKRLEPQFARAARKGLSIEGADDLMSGLPAFFESYHPIPSMLHGDLWGGHIDADSSGNPVLYDPACYYGDREADIALTELFGGLTAYFYRAYNQQLPLDSGYPKRKPLYNLYHILNHFNHLGGGYGSQASSLVRSLLRENPDHTG